VVLAQVSPVVKEKSYFARNDRRCRIANSAEALIGGNAGIPQGSGGVVLKLRVAAETCLESNLFLQVPRRDFFKGSKCLLSSAGGEDEGYFA
jgi:hypothetical protein